MPKRKLVKFVIPNVVLRQAQDKLLLHAISVGLTMFKTEDIRIKSKRQEGRGSIHYKKDFEDIRHILGKEGWDIPIYKMKERYNQIKGN